MLDRTDVVRQDVDERHDRARQLEDDWTGPHDRHERGQRPRSNRLETIPPAAEGRDRARTSGELRRPEGYKDDDGINADQKRPPKQADSAEDPEQDRVLE